MKPDSQLPDSVDQSPEQLLAPFAKGRIGLWIVVAVILHALLIGGTSMGYIRDRWIDPDGAKERKAAAEAAVAAQNAKAKPAAISTAKPAATTAAVTPASPATKPVAPAASDPNSLDARKNTPEAKRLTSASPTNEIPKAPDDLGLNLNDTNPK